MTSTRTYQDGYQAALRDVARSFAEAGPAAAADWLAANTLDPETRRRATHCADDARADQRRLDAAAAYLDACGFDPYGDDDALQEAADDHRRWQTEVDADLTAQDGAQ